MVHSIQIMGRPSKLSRIDYPTIAFTKEDARRLHHPHDDALVITLLVADYATKQVLVRNGSLANIPFYYYLLTNEDRQRTTPPFGHPPCQLWQD